MKKLFTLIAIVIAITSFGQSFKMKPLPSDTSKWYMSDTVEITNGHDELVKVAVLGSCPKDVWNNLKSTMNLTDTSAFSFIINMLAINAKFLLKNQLSFEPMKSQFFSFYDKKKSFMSSFNMMGRNGYGNLIETSEMVFYKP